MRLRWVAILLLVFASVSAHAVVVTPSALGDWQLTTSAGAGTVPPASYIAPGFKTPPLGTGSLHLVVGDDGNAAAQARNTAYHLTRIDQITTLSYSTYVDTDGSGGQAPYLIIAVDYNGDTTSEELLFFEPLYQGPTFFPSNPQGPLTTKTWQTWDALNGGWYGTMGVAGSGPGANVKSLAQILAVQPNARIVNTSGGLGGMRIVTGFGAGAWDNFVGAADNFTIDTTTTALVNYDFEPLAGTIVTVTTTSPDGWSLLTTDDGDATNTASISIVSGPATPPLGEGSLQLSVGADGGDAAQARNNLYNGLLLRDLSTLTYSTYVQVDGSGGQAPYIILNVDYDGNGSTDDFLFFEPLYQGPTFFPSNPQGPLVTGTWQSWDARSGGWWSANNTAGAGPGTNVKPLSDILDTQPDARLATDTATGAVRIVAGFGAGAWDNFVGNADALSISFTSNATTYDFEPIPSIIINDISQFEGTGGTTNFVFTLTLSEAVSQTVTVDYSTVSLTAQTFDTPPDFANTVGQASFTPFTTTTMITIVVGADNKFEPDETFRVDLTNPQFATISDPQGIATIQNDDLQPTISINDVAQAEGTGGTTNFNFSVTLSNPSYLPISANFTTNPGTATEGIDYADNTGVVNFPANSSAAQTITVVVTADSGLEPDETFFVDLNTPSNATFFDPQGLGTIQNDDGPQADLSITKTGPQNVNIGQQITYTITVTNAGPQSASNVVVTDTIPAGTTFFSATPSQGTCNATSPVICNLGAIASGGSATITLVVTATSPGPISNTATVSNTPEVDPTPGNNAATAATLIVIGGPTLSWWGLMALLAALAVVAVKRL